MFIVSENDNLLETFKIAIQNSPIGDQNGALGSYEVDENGNNAIFRATLASNRDLTGYSDRYIVLIGKEWTPALFDTISDLTRRTIALVGVLDSS